MKKLIARELLLFIALIAGAFLLAGLATLFVSNKVKSINANVAQFNQELDSLNKLDQNRKVLFYFSQVEEGTFLDKVYRDYKTTELKKFQSFQALIDTLKEYNGILFTSFPLVMMEKNKQQYYLQDMKYSDFEREAKYSLDIYDRKLPTKVLEDIRHKEVELDFDTSRIQRFWQKAIKDPQTAFNSLTESYKRYYGFASLNDFAAYLKRNDNRSYPFRVATITNDLNNLSADKLKWEKWSFMQLFLYAAIGVLGLFYIGRTLLRLVRWALQNK